MAHVLLGSQGLYDHPEFRAFMDGFDAILRGSNQDGHGVLRCISVRI